MEFRYALTTLRIPVIVCVVGTGYAWERSEVCFSYHNYQTNVKNGKQCKPWSHCFFRSSLIGVYTVCSDLAVWTLMIIMGAALWQNQHSECVPSEDSDQPGHPPSLIRVFAVRIKKAGVFSYPLSASEDSDQTEWMPRLIGVFAGRTVTLLVLSWGCSWYVCLLLIKRSVPLFSTSNTGMLFKFN